MDREAILAKLDEETKTLEKFIQDANQEIAFRRGRIALLSELLQVPPPKEGEPDDKSR